VALLVIVGRWMVSLVVVGGGSAGGVRWTVVVRGGRWWLGVAKWEGLCGPARSPLKKTRVELLISTAHLA